MRIVAALLLVSSAALVVLTTHVLAVDAAEEETPQLSHGVLAVQVLDERGSAVPARIRIRALSPFATERVHVVRTGRLATRLEPGDHHVVVSHGPEWSVHEQTVTLGAGESREIAVRLTREVEAADFTPCDLHLHTGESADSTLTLEDRVATLLAEDIAFAVVTDHNRVTDAREALARAGISTLPGAEVTTWDPEFGHFNAFPVSKAPVYKRTSVHALLAELRADPATFVQVNHPRLEDHIGYFALHGFDRREPELPHEVQLPFDALEVWNGYDLPFAHKRQEVFLDWLALLARGQRLTATGSSDSHRADRAPFAGYPRTYVRVPRARAGDSHRVLRALKAGRAFVSNGPIIDLEIDGRFPGDNLSERQSGAVVHARVSVAAPRWMALAHVEIWLGTERVMTASLPAPAAGARGHHAQLELTVPVGSEQTILAAVAGTGSMKPLLGNARSRPYAFTNPIYLGTP